MSREMDSSRKRSASFTKRQGLTSLLAEEEDKVVPKLETAPAQRKKGIFKSRTITEGVLPTFVQPWSDFAHSPKMLPSTVMEEDAQQEGEDEETRPVFRSERRGVVGSDAGLEDKSFLKELCEILPSLDEVTLNADTLVDIDESHQGGPQVAAAAI